VLSNLLPVAERSHLRAGLGGFVVDAPAVSGAGMAENGRRKVESVSDGSPVTAIGPSPRGAVSASVRDAAGSCRLVRTLK
jgi:hypothetical protein